MDDCDENANCTNTIGSFLCMCRVGFTGDGISCAGNMWLASEIGRILLGSTVNTFSVNSRACNFVLPHPPRFLGLNLCFHLQLPPRLVAGSGKAARGTLLIRDSYRGRGDFPQISPSFLNQHNFFITGDSTA